MAAILHVIKPGHRCVSPLRGLRAENIQLGECLQMGDWELFYAVRSRAYIVCNVKSYSPSGQLIRDHYEFRNFVCATAKLTQLSKGLK